MSTRKESKREAQNRVPLASEPAEMVPKLEPSLEPTVALPTPIKAVKKKKKKKKLSK